jgi:hypothetical protein
MNKKKVMGYVLTGVLSVGIIGGVGTSAFAATSDTNAVKQTVQSLDSATQEKVQKIKDELKTQMAKLGVTLPERGNRFANLDEATKTKAEAIVKKEKAGTITHEEAKSQLEALGVTLTERGHKGSKQDLLDNLDDETKAKAQDLIDNAKTELEELGVNHLK